MNLRAIQAGITLSAVAALLMAAISASQGKPQPPSGEGQPEIVTFSEHIAPIVLKNCAPCHRPGEAGPFSLLTYQDVRQHARQIAVVTKMRYMPPWLPEASGLGFADERRLSDREIGLIQRWVEQATPEGDPKDLPPAPKFTAGWQLGQPDVVVTATTPYVLPAGGTDRYWNFVLRVPIDRPHFVKAFEIRPGNRKVTHHANLLIDRTQSARKQERRPGTGFPGMDPAIESNFFDPDSHFLFWKPGTVPAPEPPGMAWRIDPGTDLVLNIHLQPSGKPEVIRPSVGLYFTDEAPTLHPMLLQIQADWQLDIPPGDSKFVVNESFTLPVAIDLLACYPHAHYLGKDLLGYATLPDGSSKTLIHIPQWDMKWQGVYRYAEAVPLPKGTVVTMHYTYDNSDSNPLNPHHPPARVRAGNRSQDEMAHLWLQVLPTEAAAPEAGASEATADPRITLQAALMQHTLQRNPNDFSARYNLGAIEQMRGQLASAIDEYRQALRLRPGNTTVLNSLGSALLAEGNLPEAIQYLRAALQGDPKYVDAHYNLGNAFAAAGEIEEAAEQFRRVVQLKPDDADGHANLGSALARLGRYAAARSEFERALRIRPGHPIARDNLEELNRINR